MLRRRLGITKPNGKIFIVIYFSVLYQLESFANIIFNYLLIVLWCRRYYIFHKFITFAIHNFLLVQTKFYFLPLLLLSLFPFSVPLANFVPRKRRLSIPVCYCQI